MCGSGPTAGSSLGRTRRTSVPVPVSTRRHGRNWSTTRRPTWRRSPIGAGLHRWKCATSSAGRAVSPCRSPRTRDRVDPAEEPHVQTLMGVVRRRSLVRSGQVRRFAVAGPRHHRRLRSRVRPDEKGRFLVLRCAAVPRRNGGRPASGDGRFAQYVRGPVLQAPGPSPARADHPVGVGLSMSFGSPSKLPRPGPGAAELAQADGPQRQGPPPGRRQCNVPLAADPRARG